MPDGDDCGGAAVCCGGGAAWIRLASGGPLKLVFVPAAVEFQLAEQGLAALRTRVIQPVAGHWQELFSSSSALVLLLTAQ